jgi:signal transduction histidine kinase
MRGIRGAAPCFGLLWLTSLAGGAAAALAEESAVFKPTVARFVMSEAEPPPEADAAGWQTRQLPDNWSTSQPGIGGNGWYRFSIALEETPDDLWAVHLLRLRMNAAVFVNGVFVGDGGRFVEPLSRNWNRPLYFPLPAGLLRQGANLVDVRVFDYANGHGGLYALEIGPDRALRRGYHWRHFLKIDLIAAFMVVTVVMGLFMATLWLRWPRESMYGWMAATMLVWAAVATHFSARDLPLSTWWWEWFAQVGTDLFAVLLAISLHRFLGLRRPRVDAAMAGYVALDAVILGGVPLERMLAVANLLHLGAVAIGGYMVATLVWYALRRGPCDSSFGAFAAGVVVQCALGLHDWLLQLGFWQHDHWYLMHYASPVLFAVLTWIVTARFVEAQRRSEALNRELEARVVKKHGELEDSYGKLRALEREQAVGRERDRIMRDLHDGLGGHLVSALALAEHGDSVAVEETLRDALEDLRLVINSLDPDSEDLAVLLGIMRMRIEKRMSSQGIAFDWHVSDVPAIPGFGPEMALQILRIVQEAFANILKHSKATTITVRSGETNGAGDRSVYLEIRDDGLGIENGRRGGRGLDNMHRRAAAIGGELRITSEAGLGTSVRLSFPLEVATRN